MKKIISLIAFSLAPLLIMAQSNFISIKGKKFIDGNGNDFYPIVMNYGVNIVEDGTGPYHISPHHSYSPTNQYLCNDAASCANEIKQNLLQMKSFGFNTIRLVGLTLNKDNIESTCSSYIQGLRARVFISNTSCNPCSSSFQIFQQNDMISLINQFLAIASDPSVNMKVILLAGGGNMCRQESKDEMKNYFASLAASVTNNNALIGYDLSNEPGGFDSGMPNDGANFRKNEICTMVSDWYNAIKANAPNHLITIGLNYPGDVTEWDPGILKLDFVSFHPYPDIDQSNSNVAENVTGLNRVLSQIYWMGNNINSPWIIGETGHVAKDNNSTPGGGTLDEQRYYAEQTLKATRDCGGSGYSWWWYKDVFHGAYDDYLGLFMHDGTDKPAASEFLPAEFNPFTIGTCTQPPNYFNPFGWSQNPVSGTVVDNSSQPVKDAVVIGFSPGFGPGRLSQTFTNNNGSFTVYRDSVQHTTGILRISAVGAQLLSDCDPLGINLPQCPTPFFLSYSQTHKDTDINNIIVPISQTFTPSPETYNNITAQNFIVDGNGTVGGNATFTAGGEITLKEFTVKRGGEFHAKYGLPQVDCNDNVFQRTMNNTIVNSNSTSSAQGEPQSILLKPENKLTAVDMTNQWAYILPNPTSDGKIAVNISDATKFSEITVTDMLGKIVQHSVVKNNINKLDISKNPKGIFFVKITGKENMIVRKIIYQ